MQEEIKRFLEVYQVLPPEGRAAFEAQMNAALLKVDEKSKQLYYSLLRSAKENLGVEEALSAMKKISLLG